MRAPVLSGALLGIALAVVLIGLAEWKRSQDHTAVRREVDVLEARLEREPLKSMRVSVDAFQRDKRRFQQVVDIVEALRESRYCPHSVLGAVDPGAASDPQVDEVSITVPTVSVGGAAASEAKVRALAEALGRGAPSLEVSDTRYEAPRFRIVGVLRGTACPPALENER
jgi:hypothetical protein